VVTRDQVKVCETDPDSSLPLPKRIGVDITNYLVLGDSIWD